ncbi:hypothetical protein KI387_023828, partial [Taxus chinensis]
AVLRTVQTSGRKPAEKPLGGLRSTGTVGPRGRVRRKRVNQPKVKAKSTNCCADKVRTSGPKRREGCEKVKLPQRGTRKPISGGSEEFVSDSTGTVGTLGHVGHGKQKEPRANQIMPRVFASKRDREARIGRIGSFCPRQFGTSRTKGRGGREKL